MEKPFVITASDGRFFSFDGERLWPDERYYLDDLDNPGDSIAIAQFGRDLTFTRYVSDGGVLYEFNPPESGSYAILPSGVARLAVNNTAYEELAELVEGALRGVAYAQKNPIHTTLFLVTDWAAAGLVAEYVPDCVMESDGELNHVTKKGRRQVIPVGASVVSYTTYYEGLIQRIAFYVLEGYDPKKLWEYCVELR